MNTCLLYTCNSEMITSVHNVMHSILHLYDTIIIISATMHGMAWLCQVEKNEVHVVMCLNSPTLPFLPYFIAFCSTHSYTSYFYENFATCSCTFFITKVYFFFADNEELLCVQKKHKSCCIMHNTCKFTYDDLFQQCGCINRLNYETGSASVI